MNNKEQLEQWIAEIDTRIKEIKDFRPPDDWDDEDIMFYSSDGVHEIKNLSEKRDVFQSILDEKYSLSAADEDDIDTAFEILAGGADTRENFEYRQVKQDAYCRACRHRVPRGEDIVWCTGNREAVIICIPCVKGLARLVRSKIL